MEMEGARLEHVLHHRTGLQDRSNGLGQRTSPSSGSVARRRRRHSACGGESLGYLLYPELAWLIALLERKQPWNEVNTMKPSDLHLHVLIATLVLLASRHWGLYLYLGSYACTYLLCYLLIGIQLCDFGPRRGETPHLPLSNSITDLGVVAAPRAAAVAPGLATAGSWSETSATLRTARIRRYC
jgi:hypothetical protein